MKVENIVSYAASNQVSLFVCKGKLIAKCNTDIMPDLLSMFRTHKQELLEHFNQEERVFYTHYYYERAAIMEYDGRLSCADAERKAFRESCVEWIYRHTATDNLSECVYCKEAIGRGGYVAYGSAYYHWDDDAHNCLKPYIKQRMPEAQAELERMGIKQLTTIGDQQ